MQREYSVMLASVLVKMIEYKYLEDLEEYFDVAIDVDERSQIRLHGIGKSTTVRCD